jgi:hypothetical protein
MIARYRQLFLVLLLIGCSVTLPGCQNGGFHPIKKAEALYGGHKAQLAQTAQLVAYEAQQIVEKDVFSNAQSAEDAVLKSWNAQGFADAGHTLEAQLPTLAIAQIPDFVMQLRQIWLPPQQHYTNMAADIGQLIVDNIQAEEKKLGRKLLPDEETQIVEGVIQGLRTAQPQALNGP